ncbi:MAG TPA: DUF86 domain-containing protein [Phycisphaerae bacterium]|jgi:uncharacterized protein YutE (UPF0331/DUF86 family)
MTLRVVLSRKLEKAIDAADLLTELSQESEAVFLSDRRSIAAAERALFLCIESMVDACELTLRLSGQRIGSHAKATVERAAAEGLIEASAAEQLMDLITFRNRLSHDYELIRPREVFAQLQPAAQLFTRLGAHFRDWVKSLPKDS